MCGALGLCSWQISSKILSGISHARPLRGRRIQSLRAFRQARVEGIRTKRKSIESLHFKRPKGVPKSIRMARGTPLAHRARPRRKRDLERNSTYQPFWPFLAALGDPRPHFGPQGGPKRHFTIYHLPFTIYHLPLIIYHLFVGCLWALSSLSK